MPHVRPERIGTVEIEAMGLGAEAVELAERSDLIIAYWGGMELIAIAGFIPQDVFGNVGYLWMHTEPAAKHWPIAVGRWGIWTLREVRQRYRWIVGHCVAGTRSIAWLTSLGAKFGEPQGDAVPFVIGD